MVGRKAVTLTSIPSRCTVSALNGNSPILSAGHVIHTHVKSGERGEKNHEGLAKLSHFPHSPKGLPTQKAKKDKQTPSLCGLEFVQTFISFAKF